MRSDHRRGCRTGAKRRGTSGKGLVRAAAQRQHGPAAGVAGPPTMVAWAMTPGMAFGACGSAAGLARHRLVGRIAKDGGGHASERVSDVPRGRFSSVPLARRARQGPRALPPRRSRSWYVRQRLDERLLVERVAGAPRSRVVRKGRRSGWRRLLPSASNRVTECSSATTGSRQQAAGSRSGKCARRIAITSCRPRRLRRRG